jgi:purine-binding chemotaxis protein CheW
VEGVINLRGRIVPVIDLRRRFGEPAAANTGKNRVVIVSSEGRLVGLMVDAASEVLKLSETQIEAAPKVLAGDETNFVTGVAKHQDRLIILIDLKKIVQPGELRRLDDAKARV